MPACGSCSPWASATSMIFERLLLFTEGQWHAWDIQWLMEKLLNIWISWSICSSFHSALFRLRERALLFRDLPKNSVLVLLFFREAQAWLKAVALLVSFVVFCSHSPVSLSLLPVSPIYSLSNIHSLLCSLESILMEYCTVFVTCSFFPSHRAMFSWPAFTEHLLCARSCASSWSS